MAKLCAQPLVKIQADMKRDFYLTAAEAVAYGLIDKVTTHTHTPYDNNTATNTNGRHEERFLSDRR